jgi:hypothetical protein
MAVLDREPVWTLWTSEGNGWSLLDTSLDRNALERQARSLMALFTTKTFMVKEGANSP